jgi:hypothetical protein
VALLDPFTARFWETMDPFAPVSAAEPPRPSLVDPFAPSAVELRDPFAPAAEEPSDEP